MYIKKTEVFSTLLTQRKNISYGNTGLMDVAEATRDVPGGLEIDISVSPRSDRSGTEGVDEWRKRLIVRVKAPPLDGRANKEVESLFKDITGCKCEVVRGQTSRQKTVLAHGDGKKILESLRGGF